MCRSAVNDGSCSPWVMCSCSVVRGNQIRDSGEIFLLFIIFILLICLSPQNIQSAIILYYILNIA